MSDTPEYIMRFMEAVYPNAAHLAMASFNEKKVIEHATDAIRELTRERDKALAEVASMTRKLGAVVAELDEAIGLLRTVLDVYRMADCYCCAPCDCEKKVEKARRWLEERDDSNT